MPAYAKNTFSYQSNNGLNCNQRLTNDSYGDAQWDLDFADDFQDDDLRDRNQLGGGAETMKMPTLSNNSNCNQRSTYASYGDAQWDLDLSDDLQDRSQLGGGAETVKMPTKSNSMFKQSSYPTQPRQYAFNNNMPNKHGYTSTVVGKQTDTNRPCKTINAPASIINTDFQFASHHPSLQVKRQLPTDSATDGWMDEKRQSAKCAKRRQDVNLMQQGTDRVMIDLSDTLSDSEIACANLDSPRLAVDAHNTYERDKARNDNQSKNNRASYFNGPNCHLVEKMNPDDEFSDLEIMDAEDWLAGDKGLMKKGTNKGQDKTCVATGNMKKMPLAQTECLPKV